MYVYGKKLMYVLKIFIVCIKKYLYKKNKNLLKKLFILKICNWEIEKVGS